MKTLPEHLYTWAYLHPACHDTPIRSKASRFLGFGNYLQTLVGLLGRNVGSIAKPLPTQATQTHKTHTHVHTLSGTQTHDLSVRAVENSTLLRRCGHCNRACVCGLAVKFSDWCCSIYIRWWWNELLTSKHSYTSYQHMAGVSMSSNWQFKSGSSVSELCF
jgi:hypothetical protein